LVSGALVSTTFVSDFSVSLGSVLPQAVIDEANSNAARMRDNVLFISSPLGQVQLNCVCHYYTGKTTQKQGQCSPKTGGGGLCSFNKAKKQRSEPKAHSVVLVM
jgi:hypothetical protein